MFSEILRIKPVLDTATTKNMEQTLSSRFSNVARRFGAGIKGALKGSILGISFGLLNKLLNPIQELEDKIKGLLGQGTDLKDLADRFGAKPGEVKRLQDIGTSLGIKPEQLTEMMSKFADAVDNARKEIDSGGDLSKSSVAVKQFTGENNTVVAFQNFLAGLRQVTDVKARQGVEKDIFGEKLTGRSKQLVETDLQKQAAKVGDTDINAVNKAVQNLSDRADQQRLLDVQAKTKDFLAASGNIDSNTIKAMESRSAAKDAEETSRLKSYQDLEKTSQFLDESTNLLNDISGQIITGIRMLTELVGDIKEVRKSSIWRGIFGGGGK